MKSMLKTKIKTQLQTIKTRTLALTAIVLLTIGFSGLYLSAFDTPISVYECTVVDESQIYDGDTIQDCKVHIADIENNIELQSKDGEIWPSLVIEDNALYVITDVRIAGIDAPEKRVSTKNKDGSLRSERSRDNERFAADQARTALIQLLRANDYKFQIENPKQGKYSGQIVAHCLVNGIYASKWLIQRGYAVRYNGGTKPKLDWDNLPNGKVR